MAGRDWDQADGGLPLPALGRIETRNPGNHKARACTTPTLRRQRRKNTHNLGASGLGPARALPMPARAHAPRHAQAQAGDGTVS